MPALDLVLEDFIYHLVLLDESHVPAGLQMRTLLIGRRQNL